MKKNLILHLGAHKTATTYIQDTFEKNIEILNENDISYIPRSFFRRNITEKYFYPKNIDKPMETSLINVVNELELNCSNLIISDESLIGLVSEQLENGLYNNTKKRLLKLKEFIGKDFNIKEVHYTVRPYDTYFPSAYCETLRRKDFYTFDIVKDKLLHKIFDWNVVLDDINEVFNESDIVVFDYRNIKESKDKYFKRLMFDKDIDLQFINQKIRAGYSKDVVEALSLFNSEYGNKKISEQLKKSIISNFNKKNERYYPFNEFESSVLAKLYQGHLDSIARKYELLGL